MKLRFTISKHEYKVEIAGNLDQLTVFDDLITVLDDSQSKAIKEAGNFLLDFSGVEQVDTAGLAWVINALRDIRQLNISGKAINLPEKLISLARLSNADTLIT